MSAMWRRSVLVVSLGALLAGCGGDPASSSNGGQSSGGAAGAEAGASGGSSGATTDAAAADVSNNAGYPAGPYGTQPGSTLANLELVGYLRHDTTGLAYQENLAPLSFESL